jgi:signal peptidase I
MTPTLRPGDVLWAESPHSLKRGDIVVVRKSALLLKRVIGLPGERLHMRSGRILVNDVPLSEPYVPETASLEPRRDGHWTLQSDTYFVLGDARDDSLDSRKFGPVKREELTGVVTRRLWPFRTWGKLTVLILGLSMAGVAQTRDPHARILAFAADNQLSPSIGAYVPGQGWIQPSESNITAQPAEVFTLFGVSGRLGEATIEEKRRPTPGDPPIAWSVRIERSETTLREPYALAIQGSWPDTEAPARALALDDPKAVHIAAEYLKKHGLQVVAPYLTQAYEVDLDGNGQTETVVCAHSDLKALTDDKPGDIYAVALVHRAGPRGETTISLASQVSHKPAWQTREEHMRFYGKRDFYRLIAFHDIDGDGKREIVLYRAKDGATQIDVFAVKKHHAQRVLTVYKPHYN